MKVRVKVRVRVREKVKVRVGGSVTGLGRCVGHPLYPQHLLGLDSRF